MRIVYIHQHFATTKSATGTRSYEMAQRLIQRGHQVTMICGALELSDFSTDLKERVTRFEVDGIDVRCVNQPYANKMGFYQRMWAFLRFAQTATTLAIEAKPDLIFATSTPLTVGIPAMRASKRLKVPFVFEVRDLWPELAVALEVVKSKTLIAGARWLERKTYFSARRIIALAPGMKEGICETGYPAERVTIVPNGCDLDLFQPSEERATRADLGGDDFKLVFTGAHGLANGLDAVLNAAVELKQRGERGVKFIFIGAGREKPRLMERTKSEQLDEYVIWKDLMPKQELAALLPQIDVGMMILKNVRGFYFGTSPNKFFDYIASGMPVLNNYPGWLAGMIEEAGCGKVVPPDDPAAFADAVVWMRDHRRECREMGRRARLLAEERFGRDTLGERFVDTIELAAREAGIMQESPA
ncbi:MAG: glycosyltransferase family 4 protein [Phycisphaerales bacterium]|nr:glycosyltransferase family 4 protein [Phycisphaerales bacterium]